jgi:hypothetical protein
MLSEDQRQSATQPPEGFASPSSIEFMRRLKIARGEVAEQRPLAHRSVDLIEETTTNKDLR